MAVGWLEGDFEGGAAVFEGGALEPCARAALAANASDIAANPATVFLMITPFRLKMTSPER